MAENLAAKICVTSRTSHISPCSALIKPLPSVQQWDRSDEWLPAESLNKCGGNRAYSDSRCSDDDTCGPLGVSISHPTDQGYDLHQMGGEEVGYTQVTTTTRPTDNWQAISIARDATDPMAVLARHIAGDNQGRNESQDHSQQNSKA